MATRLRVLDWGDSSISHPFASLVVTFRFLEEFNKLPPGDPWFPRLRDAYLEPWGHGLTDAFALARAASARSRTSSPGSASDDHLDDERARRVRHVEFYPSS